MTGWRQKGYVSVMELRLRNKIECAYAKDSVKLREYWRNYGYHPEQKRQVRGAGLLQRSLLVGVNNDIA